MLWEAANQVFFSILRSEGIKSGVCTWWECIGKCLYTVKSYNIHSSFKNCDNVLLELFLNYSLLFLFNSQMGFLDVTISNLCHDLHCIYPCDSSIPFGQDSKFIWRTEWAKWSNSSFLPQKVKELACPLHCLMVHLWASGQTIIQASSTQNTHFFTI